VRVYELSFAETRTERYVPFMKSITYLFIRMWAPHTESDNPEDPHYVARVEHDEGEIQWTVTREFTEANYFKCLKTAERVIRGVKRIADRILRGWLYEIIHVEEKIVETNVPEKEPAEETA
jgi:hypothetical protein